MVQTCLMRLDCPQRVLLAVESQVSAFLVPAVALEYGRVGRRALCLSSDGARLENFEVEEMTEVGSSGGPFCTTEKLDDNEIVVIVDDRRILTWATGVTTAMIEAEDEDVFVNADVLDPDNDAISPAQVSRPRTCSNVEASSSEDSRGSTSITTGIVSASEERAGKNTSAVRRRWRERLVCGVGRGGREVVWWAVGGGARLL
jgi:hypothetical protein